jgi:predicted transcriptional regulator
MPAKILVRTSDENKDWLKQLADAQERSVNWLVHKMFTDARLAAQAKANA